VASPRLFKKRITQKQAKEPPNKVQAILDAWYFFLYFYLFSYFVVKNMFVQARTIHFQKELTISKFKHPD
jgi:hypothetical protein